MTAPEIVGYFFTFGLIVSIIALAVGGKRPSMVLPKSLDPDRKLVHLVYGVLILWFLLGAIGFLFLSSV